MNDKVKIDPMPDDYDFSSAPKVVEGQLPTWDEVDEHKPAKEEILVEASKSFAPKIMIYGCGGFGVNVVRRLPELLEHHDNIHYRIFDTSMANVNKEAMPDEVETIMVGEDGKGKLRGTNLDVL